MVLAKDISFEEVKHEADVEMLVKNMVQTNSMIVHLKDEQFEMCNEIKRRDENISKLEDEIRLLKKEKRWNMLWHNRLNDSIDKIQIIFGILFLINIIFAYFMNR
ncbi:hypothetical protein [Leuconostoc mesenteroides]|uniref:hypothetical protein n=1 Tax=Leuconostoc mesenteroides TaxID=1245 RepID=UPI0010AEC61D|nr:hypothetical protein [Leuconostoc mesenteroides]TJY30606.1 hypothetical protein FCF26_05200 [Leuconostoc mesenteroides subsp. mesenteroides]